MTEIEPAAVPAQQGAGAMLREAREHAGVHIASLAVALKVPVARLEALEAERFDLLPGLPFVRALAASVCRALRVDPAPVLAVLPQRVAPAIAREPERPEPAPTFRPRPPGAARSPAWGAAWRHPVSWAVLLLLLAAGALMLVPAAQLEGWSHALSDTLHRASEPAAQAPAPQAAPAAAEPPAPPAAAAVTVPDPVLVPSASTRLGADSAAAAASAMTPAPAQAAVGGGETLRLEVTEPTWVRVTDPQGATVFEKVLAAGAVQTLDRPAPLKVVVGNARAATVQVRGQPLALEGVSRNNVARFEVR